MTNVLYVNHGLGTKCGVYDFGVRHFASLRNTDDVYFYYREINTLDEYLTQCEEVRPDAVFFNYMHMVLPWVGAGIKAFPAKLFVIQHLYDNDSVSPLMNAYAGLFDYMICLDPSLPTSDSRIFALGRPIPTLSVAPRALSEHVNIGSFGFGMPHKQFHLIAREINRCFDNATFNLHMTVGDFTGDYSAGIIESVEAELTKPGVTLNWTSTYLSESEVVEKMSMNDMNALFYALPKYNAGLSSAADYMVAAQRPLLVSDCASFKHLLHGTYQWPSVSFGEIAGNWDWCQNHSFELYERSVNKLSQDTIAMLKKTL